MTGTPSPAEDEKGAGRFARQHARDAVHWRPWGTEAFDEARRRDVPVLVSSGYSTCHWCHVMMHDTYRDPGIGRLVEAETVPVLLDREEHPDADFLLMQCLTAVAGSGGWPITALLTPDGRPFHLATYLPPTGGPGGMGLAETVESLGRLFRDDRARVMDHADNVATVVRARLRVEPDLLLLDADGDDLRDQMIRGLDDLGMEADDRYGGYGTAAKFPAPLTDLFLVESDSVLRAGARRTAEALAAVDLRAMALGQLHDPVGGGFFRYCTHRDWTEPHFEKMLLDNALLLEAYAVWTAQTRDPLGVLVTRMTADFLLRELADPAGGFRASLDADDPNGGEGSFYRWTSAQIAEALTAAGMERESNGSGEDAAASGVDPAAVARMLSITDETSTPSWWALLAGADGGTDLAALERNRGRLLAYRDARPRPGADTTVRLGTSCLAITALVRAAEALDDPLYAEAARGSLDGLERCLGIVEGVSGAGPGGVSSAWSRLPRAFTRDGRAGDVAAGLGDVAAWALARLALGEDASDALDMLVLFGDPLSEDPDERLGDRARAVTDPLDGYFGHPLDVTDATGPAGAALASLACAEAGRWSPARAYASAGADAPDADARLAGTQLRALVRLAAHSDRMEENRAGNGGEER